MGPLSPPLYFHVKHRCTNTQPYLMPRLHTQGSFDNVAAVTGLQPVWYQRELGHLQVHRQGDTHSTVYYDERPHVHIPLPTQTLRFK